LPFRCRGPRRKSAATRLKIVSLPRHMTTKLTKFPKIAKAGAAFFLCWLAGSGVSYILIYSRFRWPDNHLIVFFLNQIFFYVQTALPRSFATIGDNNHEVLSGPAAIMVGIIFWLAIGFAFAWLTRRLRLYFTVPLAVVSIFVVLIAAQALLYFFSIQIEVIAP
jgi:hypothetical protein